MGLVIGVLVGIGAAATALVGAGLFIGRFLFGGNKPTEDSKYIYHYTSKNSARLIRDSGFIATSKDKALDALAGEGVYLTTLPPDTACLDLIQNNYNKSDGISEMLKVEVGFKFLKRNLPGARRVSSRLRVIYVHQDPIDLTEVSHEVIYRK